MARCSMGLPASRPPSVTHLPPLCGGRGGRQKGSAAPTQRRGVSGQAGQPPPPSLRDISPRNAGGEGERAAAQAGGRWGSLPLRRPRGDREACRCAGRGERGSAGRTQRRDVSGPARRGPPLSLSSPRFAGGARRGQRRTARASPSVAARQLPLGGSDFRPPPAERGESFRTSPAARLPAGQAGHEL